jgi:hypothetical protein
MRKSLLLLLLCASSASAAIFVALNSGELTPLLKYRTDLEKRQMGVETLTNFVVKQQGAAFRRSGTEYIGEINDVNYAARMMPFEYSTSDTYVLVFNKDTIAFYRTVE